MTNDPIGLLERELVEAAGRQVGAAARVGPVRRLGGGLASAAVLIATLVIAGGALIFLSGAHRRTPAASAAAPGRQQLVEALGVLRRPQTSADLHSPAITALLATYNPRRAPWDRFGRPDLGLIRRAAVAPWGQNVFLIPVGSAADRHQEGLLVLVGRRGFLDCCATAGDVKTGGAVMNAGQSGDSVASRAGTRFLTLVPDGVARVELMLPSWPGFAGLRGAPRYRGIVAPVRGNVAAFQVSGQCCGGPPIAFWFDGDGNVTRRIGDLVGNYRSVALSPPRPATPVSRAAERDPSTPNPVWVTPRSGGKHAVFTVHFRVLLNVADYGYQVTGPCQTPTGNFGAPDDSRGWTWSDRVTPTAGKAWCRGTHHISVSVTDLGPFGTLKHAAQPFGAATFTVR